MEAKPSSAQLMRIRRLTEGGKAGQDGHTGQVCLLLSASPLLPLHLVGTSTLTASCLQPTPLLFTPTEAACVHRKGCVLRR